MQYWSMPVVNRGKKKILQMRAGGKNFHTLQQLKIDFCLKPPCITDLLHGL